ncbi:cation:proton antiporter [Aliidiomarina sp. Khilg15.8]
MTWVNALQIVFVSAGLFFFLVGTLGLLRFPDVYTRIHALTKADNLGLGLIMVGLLPGITHFSQAFKLIVVWVLVLAASATAGYLVAQHKRREQEDA